MNNTIKYTALMALFVSFSAQADLVLQDKTEILGKWTVFAEAAKLEGEKKNINVEWDFGADGILNTTSTDSVGRTKEMKIAIKYSVENGELKKQTVPGREKYETCKVVEKQGANMVLKCVYLYYFLTRQ